jgi:hypothetical protein
LTQPLCVKAVGVIPQALRRSLLEIVRRTSAELPADVRRAIAAGRTWDDSFLRELGVDDSVLEGAKP